MKNNYSSFLKSPRLSVLIFFLAYLIIGLSVYKDYGISWDEPTHREIASVTVKYLASIFMPEFQPPEFASLPNLAEYSTKQYGVVFDLPMYIADMLMGYNGRMPEAYYMRHLCTFLLFYVSVFFFYLIVRKRYDSWILGLMACSFLILTPRIFAQSFYGKDVVFLSLFIISIYFFVRYLSRKTITSSLLFALTTAIVIDQRITGIFIPFIAVLIAVIDIIRAGKPFNNLQNSLLPLFMYLSFCSLFVVLFWPYLWENPVKNFINAFTVMNKFPISYYILYFGNFIRSTEVPWHYIPVWILITTPLLYLFFFLIGAFLEIKLIRMNGLKFYSNDKERQDFLFLLLFIVPLASVIILNSALYDGWRHMYFIYAPFLLITIAGASRVLGLMQKAGSGREKRAALFIAMVIVLCVVSTSYQMIRCHPFQNVYFNAFPGDNVGKLFELDYWGLSFRRGLEYVISADASPAIALSANVYAPLINNTIFINKEDLKRIRIADINHANYYLTNYRWHPYPYKFGHEVYSITVDKQKIMSVFKLR